MRILAPFFFCYLTLKQVSDEMHSGAPEYVYTLSDLLYKTHPSLIDQPLSMSVTDCRQLCLDMASGVQHLQSKALLQYPSPFPHCIFVTTCAGTPTASSCPRTCSCSDRTVRCELESQRSSTRTAQRVLVSRAYSSSTRVSSTAPLSTSFARFSIIKKPPIPSPWLSCILFPF
jgi:hypothetical protein